MCLIPTYKEALSHVKRHTFDPVAHLLEFIKTVVYESPGLWMHNFHFGWVALWIKSDRLPRRISILDVKFNDEAAKDTCYNQFHCLIKKHAALYKPYVEWYICTHLVQIFIKDDQLEVPCESEV